MTSIVIAEKPSQARMYQRTIGRSYGTVLAARGHLFELEAPERVNPAWAVWSDTLLLPEKGFYPNVLKEDADIRKRFREMAEAAKSADTIYLATDPDREGEGIALNILQELQRKGFRGRAMRVLPLGEDKASVEKAFAIACPIEDRAAVYSAFQARSQSDQIFNLSLTRAATTLLRSGSRGVVSIGRVITPTLGIVCKREKEIENFRPQDYFVPSMTVQGDAGTVKLAVNSGAEERMFDRTLADKASADARGYRGPIKAVTTAKKEAPPHLFSMSSLQVACSSRWKWSSKKTAEVLQNLYSKHQVLTYPRSSEVSLPEAEIANVGEMKQGIEALFGDAGFDAQIRTRKGAFSDKDLNGASHFAIVPNVNTVNRWKRAFDEMSTDEKRLFELVSRRYLAMLGPDRLYDSTTLSVKPAEHVFRVTGTVEREPGWKRALGASSDASPAGDKEDSPRLPPFQNGDQVACIESSVEKKQTTPPTRLTEGGLIELMINCWKLVEDKTQAEILRETKGIGTVATRQVILANLLHRGLARSEKGKLSATPAGMALFDVLRERAPSLLDVATTARMEMALDEIEKGRADARETVHAIAELARQAIEALRAAAEAAVKIDVGGSRAPTAAMLKAARAKAKREGKRLTADISKSFDACRAYLGPMTEGGHPPSPKQIAYAKSIAQETGAELPEEVLGNSLYLSKWIDLNKKPGGRRRGRKSKPASRRLNGGTADQSGAVSKSDVDSTPSAKQMSFAEGIARRKCLTIPSAAIVDRRELSRWIDDHK